MGGADTPCREDIGVAGAGCIHRRDDLGLDVGDDPGLAHGDAERAQLGSQIGQVHVLSSTRQDLVADDENRGGRGGCRRRILGHDAGGALKGDDFAAQG